MIIQVILIVGLLLSFVYALLQRQQSQLVTIGMSAVSLTGVYFVLVPESTQQLADLVGVGRGADLIMYCWLVISLIVSVNLQFKILRLQRQITELARKMTLQAAGEPARPHEGV